MTYTRKNIYSLGDDWAPEVLWYARGVAAMSARPLADPTGWRFFGAIHGFNAPLWTSLGWLSGSDQMPSQQLQDSFWKQCQHGSWYFLPWHRGYLLGIEAILRCWIVGNGGPADWALPYWNYMASGQGALPTAFASNNWPDGGDNPLFRAQRYGPNGDGNVFVPQDEVNLDALTDLDFSGPGGGGDTGFGGVETAFSHSGRQHGRIETQPHDYVHGLVGGQQDNTGPLGLMSDPRTAGLDPIFYLHHANIDRYWQVWLDLAGGRANPVSGPWPDGPPLVPPVSGSPTGFAMPGIEGSVTVFEPGQLATLGQVNYTYDDLTAPDVQSATAARLERLGVGAAGWAAGTMEDEVGGRRTELLGANDAPVRIAGASVSTDVRIAPSVASRVSASFSAVAGAGAEAAAEPDRVFLNLENVRGLNDAARFQVYVAAPGGGEEYRAGSIALFGVTQATSGEEEHAGNGISYTLDITPIVDQLHLSGAALDAGQLSVRIVPVTPVAEEHEISIGRVSIYRQGE